MALANASSVVVADGLIKQFGRFAALRGVSGDFASGKLFVVVGENGAGKTTLLRIIAGLSQPTRGAVSVLGSSNIKNVRAQIGYMAHPSLLYDEMSGIENLIYFAGRSIPNWSSAAHNAMVIAATFPKPPISPQNRPAFLSAR